jgi:hypothetical protein
MCGTDLGRIQTELLRQFSADETVLVNILRKLRYKHYYKSENFRLYKILQALRFLTTHDTLWREAGVQLCSEFIESLSSASRVESAALPRLTDVGALDSGECMQFDEESMSESSDDEPRDAHVLGDETMIDDGIADADVRDSMINVVPAEGQRPLCLYLDRDAEEMANPDIFGGRARPINKYSYKQLCRVEMRHVK